VCEIVKRCVNSQTVMVREGGRWGDFPEARLKMTPNRGQKSGLRTLIWPLNHENTKSKGKNFLAPSALSLKAKFSNFARNLRCFSKAILDSSPRPILANAGPVVKQQKQTLGNPFVVRNETLQV